MGKHLMFLGGLLLILGLIMVILGKLIDSGGEFGWLGKLPGDVIIKRDRVTWYFPIATSILISVVGSLILYLLFRR